MTPIEAALRDMLGPSVAVALSDPRETTDDLMPDEQAYITRAIPKRRYEFAAGRRAARHALTELGLPPTAIPQAPDRAPVWPEGIVGSITHCDTLCIAALAPKSVYNSLGIDIEPSTTLSADLHKAICTAPELHYLASLPSETRGVDAKRIFCAKEAFYKAQYPLTLKSLGFQDVTLQFSLEQSLFHVKSGGHGSILVQTINGLILASCAVSA